MIVLVIKTDQPRAILGLYNDYEQLSIASWDAHRELTETFYNKLQELLGSNNIKLADINGIVCFKGPGSFTGLRIGLSAANGLAYTNGLSIVSTTGSDWIEKGIDRLLHGDNEKLALPYYGADAHITQPKK